MAQPTRLPLVIEPFLRQMAADGRMQSSIRSYRRELLSMCRTLGDVPLSCLTADNVNSYLTSPRVRLKADRTPKEGSTLNRVKSVIRAFFRWCERTGLIRRSPAAHVRLNVTSPPVTSYLTRREVEWFLRTIRRTQHPLAPRDYALFSTLVYTGIRLSDVIGLQRGDLDPWHRRLVLQRCKGGRREERHLPDRLRQVLSGYLNGRGRAPASAEGPLFVSSQGRPLSPRAVQYRFAFWLQRAGLRKRLSVHSLRHTFGALLYQATKDLVLVSRALGHGDVKSTQRYAHLDDRALARAVNRMW